MRKLSVTIITRNEEDNIRRCMESVLPIADEIIVVDSGSTDRTGEIVTELGGRFVFNQWPGYRDQKNVAISLTKNDWIFSIDADEWIDETLALEITALLSREQICDAYEIDRQTMFIGEFVRVWSPDWIIRLFRKSCGSFGGGTIHESVKVSSGATCGKLSSKLFHETDRDLAQYFIRNCEYTSVAARNMYDSGKPFRYSKLIFSPLWGFAKRFFIKGGWSDGYRGLIISATGSFYSFMQYAKLWDLYRRRGFDGPAEADPAKKPFILGHVNLAQGFRGGERQTEMLIKCISQEPKPPKGFDGVRQILFVRNGSPLVEHLADVQGLSIVEIRKPFVLSLSELRDCTLIHGHENHGARLATEAHALYSIPFVFTRRVTNVISNNVVNRYVYDNVRRVICLSSAIETIVQERFPGTLTAVIPSMSSDLECSQAIVDEIRSRFKGKILVGHAGALVKKDKGHHLIIDMARELATQRPDIHFLFLGKGRDEGVLKEQAAGLSNITFEGFQPNVGDYLSAFDIFLFPSLMEGFGSVLLDTMRFGTPIVAAKTGGIPDLINDGVNGLLFERGSIPEMKNTLLRLIDDKDLQKTLSQGALESVKGYDARVIAARHLELYDRILSGQSEEP